MRTKIRKSTRKWIRMCGFRKRMRTRGGRAILSRRRRINRKFNIAPKNKRRR
ncbi:MAG: 50S ribosomal protein L34 [Planctomycetota bacterium]